MVYFIGLSVEMYCLRAAADPRVSVKSGLDYSLIFFARRKINNTKANPTVRGLKDIHETHLKRAWLKIQIQTYKRIFYNVKRTLSVYRVSYFNSDESEPSDEKTNGLF